MKKFVIIAVLGLCALSLYARGIREDANRADEKARQSYAFGMAIGSNLSSTGLEFDYAAFAEGMRAMLEGTGFWFSEEEAVELVENALEKAMERLVAENRAEEVYFLTMNSARPEVQILPSGLQYEVLAEGDGEKPGFDSVVRVHYEGTLTDGSVFDNSYDEDGGTFIPLSHVIPGWREGIMLMNTGSIYRLYIPSDLAYGSSGIGGMIPPYSTVIFTVELLEIIHFEEEDEEF